MSLREVSSVPLYYPALVAERRGGGGREGVGSQRRGGRDVGKEERGAYVHVHICKINVTL